MRSLKTPVVLGGRDRYQFLIDVLQLRGWLTGEKKFRIRDSEGFESQAQYGEGRLGRQVLIRTPGFMAYRSLVIKPPR